MKQTRKVLDKARGELAALRKSLIELNKQGNEMEASALRDEIGVKEELVKRLLTSVEERNLQLAFPPRIVLLDRAELPKGE